MLRAVYNPVSDRILAQSLGFAWDERYFEALHGKARTVRDFHEGYDIVEKRVNWMCKKVGDP